MLLEGLTKPIKRPVAVVILFAVVLCGCQNKSTLDKRSGLPKQGLKIEETDSGSFKVTFTSAYMYGDIVSYKSDVNGEGQGKILDMIVQEDGIVYYAILLDDGTAQSGIYPEAMKLIRRDYKTENK